MEHEVFAISLTAANDSAAPVCRPVRPCGPEAAQAESDRATAEFVTGPENRLVGTAIDWLLHPGEHGYSPLVLHGPSGTGKSQLAQEIARVRGDAVYTYATDFARELADAIDKGTVQDWRTRYRSAGLLILEDLTQIADREAAQLELLHTLDELESRQVPVVITSRLAPAEMSRLPAALRSRLSAGLEVPLSPPELAARAVILERLATARGCKLAPGTARLLATELPVTAAELRGIFIELEIELKSALKLNRVAPSKATSEVHDPATKPLAISTQQVRRFLSARRARLRPSLQQVAALVSKYFGLKSSQLCGPSRRQQVALARSVAIYLSRQLTGKSLQSLGIFFGNRDHTTILHSYRMIESRISHDRQLHTTVSQLRKTLLPSCVTGE